MEPDDYVPEESDIYKDCIDYSLRDDVSCSRCGEQGLHWQEIINAHGFPALALFNAKNRKHVCPQDTELFNVVPE